MFCYLDIIRDSSKRKVSMRKILTTDEIQEVIKLVESYLVDLQLRWDAEKPPYVGKFGICRNYLTKGTIFLLQTLDEMIQFVEGIIPLGKDKKETVMLVVGKMFDYIIMSVLPIWLKPMSIIIRKVAVEIIFSEMIDFVVEKYNAGYWKAENEKTQV